jgi:hypothetical protein
MLRITFHCKQISIATNFIADKFHCRQISLQTDFIVDKFHCRQALADLFLIRDGDQGQMIALRAELVSNPGRRFRQ